MESRAVGIGISAHMESRCVQGYATMLGPGTILRLINYGPGAVVQVVKVLALHAQDPMLAPVLIPAATLSHPAPCLWPRKAIKDGPKPGDPAPMWEIQKKFLALGFGSA